MLHYRNEESRKAASEAVQGRSFPALQQGFVSSREYGAVCNLKGRKRTFLPESSRDSRIAGRMVYRLFMKYGLETPGEQMVAEPISYFWPWFLRKIGVYPLV